MQKTFNFGKVDYNHSGRKNCEVEITAELRDRGDGKLEFAASGVIWNPRHTDSYIGGQCLDTINEYLTFHSPKFTEIYRLWKAYHLNTMHAGTKKQEEALKEWHGIDERYDYESACKYLESIGLFEDIYEGKPYKYGHGWCYEPIPEDDLKIIRELLA